MRVAVLATVLWTSASLTVVATIAPSVEVEATHEAVAAQQKPFKHFDHVQVEWLDPATREVWRDCRSCHRFSAEQPISAPQRYCDDCHIAPGLLQREFLPDWGSDLSGNSTRTRDAFRHHTHGMLECRQCHPSQRLDAVASSFKIRTGPGQCAECHEGGRPRGEAERLVASLRFFTGATDPETAKNLQMAAFTPPLATDYFEYAQKLAAVFAGPTGGINTTPLPVGGDFDHADHCGKSGGELGGLIACVDCHTNIQRAGARQVGAADIPIGKCGECHIANDAGQAARKAPGARQREAQPLWSLGTFSHADHFAGKTGVCGEAAYAKIAQGCAACHKYGPEAVGRPGRDFPFKKGSTLHTYGDCSTCHDLAGWQTGETAAAPLHASTGRGGDGWQGCASCHVFGAGDLKSTRLMATVERATERTFTFPANTHPDISELGRVRGEAAGRATVPDCKDCHRARVPELPTRLANKGFRHETHLRTSPEAKDCLECHPAAATAGSSAALAGEGQRTYSLAGCAKCHWGEVKESVAAGEALATKRASVEFAHDRHVTTGKLSCLECHAPASDGRDVLTKPKAADCTQCHDHKRGGPEDRGLGVGGAASCVRCHHREPAVPGAPLVAIVPPRGTKAGESADPRFVVTQAGFGGFADAQFHPLGRACTDCHKASVRQAGEGAAKRAVLDAIDLPVADHVLAVRSTSVHGATGGGAMEPAACLRCHVKPKSSRWELWVDGSSGSAAEKAFRKDPMSARTRREFGNDATGYPGTAKARG